jgi:predicted AAA+ superfamily ATPase
MKLQYALLEHPIIYIAGPTQSGKTKLLASVEENFTYIDLNDKVNLKLAQTYPAIFIKSLPPKTIINNAILAPQLFKQMRLYFNQLVLKNNGYVVGYFLLTGQTKIDRESVILENLSGYIEIITLLPLSAAEIRPSSNINFIHDLFTKSYQSNSVKTFVQLSYVIKHATFPYFLLEKNEDSAKWYKKYLNKLINEDSKNLSYYENRKILVKILEILKNKVGEILDYESLAKTLKLGVATCKQYIELLDKLYLLILLKDWEDERKDVVYFQDTPLLMDLLGEKSYNESEQKELIIKNFVASELTKHISTLEAKYYLSHGLNKKKSWYRFYYW